MYEAGNVCVACSERCATCSGSPTMCMSCDAGQGLFLANGTCKNNTDLIGICTVFINDGGCAKCGAGYYRYERDCVLCRDECATCLNGDRCLGAAKTAS